jgi:hypothetical protein
LRPTSTFGGYGDAINGRGATDGAVAVGTWSAQEPAAGYGTIPPFLAVTRENPIANGALAYAIGQLTPPAGLPSSGTAVYDQSASSVSGYLQSSGGRLSVLWGASTPRIGLDLTRSHNCHCTTYRILTTGGIENPALSEVALRAGTSTFFGTGIPVPTCNDHTGCTADAEGFFAGNGAGNAGVVYRIKDASNVELVLGASAFAFNRFTEPPAIPGPGSFTPGPLDPAAPGPMTVVRAGGPANIPMSTSALGILSQNPATLAIDGFGQAAFTQEFARGAAQSADVGGDSIITWGRWTNGSYAQVQTFGNTPVALGAEQGLHYAIGGITPAANMPGAGTANANFSLMGATSPTFGDGAMAPGTFAGALAVSWGGAVSTRVGMTMTVTMPGDSNYVATTSGALANPAASQIQVFGGSAQFTGTVPVVSPGRACASNPGACNVNVTGFFAGPAAQRAGLAYQIGSGNAQQSIYGAAAFIKQ